MAHPKIIHDIKPFACKLCDYSGNRRENLKQHMITHASKEERRRHLKPCPYENCNYQSPYTSNINSHLRNHTNSKPFKCTRCDFAARYSGNLKVHMYRHADKNERERLTQVCPIQTCNYKTVYRSDFNQHIRKHLAENPLVLSVFNEVLAKNKLNRILSRMKTSNQVSCIGLSANITLPVSVKEEIQTDFEEEDDYAFTANSERKNRIQKFTGTRSRNDDSYLLTKIKSEQRENTDNLVQITTSVGYNHLVNYSDSYVPKHSKASKGKKVIAGSRVGVKLVVSKRSASSRGSCKSLRGQLSLKNLNVVEQGNDFFKCKGCSYCSSDNKLLAMHNEQVHSVPFIVLNSVYN